MTEHRLSLKFKCPKCDAVDYLSKDKLREIKWYGHYKCVNCDEHFMGYSIDGFINKVGD
ncbi:MAG: hypothetical protein ACQERX_06010 [Bacillota bacterium]